MSNSEKCQCFRKIAKLFTFCTNYEEKQKCIRIMFYILDTLKEKNNDRDNYVLSGPTILEMINKILITPDMIQDKKKK